MVKTTFFCGPSPSGLVLQVLNKNMFERYFCMAWPLLDLFNAQMTVCQVLLLTAQYNWVRGQHVGLVPFCPLDKPLSSSEQRHEYNYQQTELIEITKPLLTRLVFMQGLPCRRRFMYMTTELKWASKLLSCSCVLLSPNTLNWYDSPNFTGQGETFHVSYLRVSSRWGQTEQGNKARECGWLLFKNSGRFVSLHGREMHHGKSAIAYG